MAVTQMVQTSALKDQNTNHQTGRNLQVQSP